MEEKTIELKPDGYNQIEGIINDLYGLIISHSKDPLLAQVLGLLIDKLKFTQEILNYRPRLPFYQIEQEIKIKCKADQYMHGITLRVLFIGKFPNTDLGKLGLLKINVIKNEK